MSYYSWQSSGIPPCQAPYNRTSPNLLAVHQYLDARWTMQWLGGYGCRSIRNGTSTSTHSWGAAIDTRYAASDQTPGWQAKRDEIATFLVDNHVALGVMAIHDYRGSRIWRRGRGWRANTTASGMGEGWATYFHIETDPTDWPNATPVADRLTPPTTPEDDMAKMTVINVRWDGYADVVTGFHSSQETMRNNGLDPADYVLLPKPTAAKRAEIEAQLGHKLTPYSG